MTLLDRLAQAISPEAWDDSWWAGKAHESNLGQSQAKQKAREAAERVAVVIADWLDERGGESIDDYEAGGLYNAAGELRASAGKQAEPESSSFFEWEEGR